MLGLINFKFFFVIFMEIIFCTHTAFSVGPRLERLGRRMSIGNYLPGLRIERPTHVIIGPVTNLTVLWKGHSNVVVSWLPPQVYVNHDVQEPESVKPGDKISVTKIKQHITMVAQNKTGGPVGPRISSSSSFKDSFREVFKVFAWDRKDQAHWECKPFSYFGDYTVGVVGEIPADKATPVVLLRNTDMVKQQTVEIGKDQALVKFEEGCLESFTVVWQEINNTDSTLLEAKSMQIAPNVRTANITDLTPGTPYRISVIAKFKAEKKLDTHPAIYITTASMNETEECECEWPGTVGDSMTCNRAPGAKYCTCEVGYEGEFCQRCAPGYYRTAPHFPCHACPCNMHGTNKTTCSFVEGFLRCDSCEVGYTGSMCHICTSGFYRYRKYCVPCHCNGNTPNDAVQMCLPSTGMCRNCLYNTTGFHCEFCLHGYVGDAKSFRKCSRPDDAPPGAGSQPDNALLAAGSQPEQGKTSSLSPGVIITITLLVLLAIATVGFLVFRRYQTWKRRKGPAFWTVGMSPNGDAVDINSVHNHDARLEDEDEDYKRTEEVDYREGRGGGKNSKYLRLVEDA